MKETINKLERKCPKCRRILSYSGPNELKHAIKHKSVCRFCAGSSIDHTNKRFGRLVARKPTEQRIRRQVVWECVCDCGKEVLAGATELQMGSKKSCGCLTAWRGYGEISGSYWCHIRNMAKKRGIALLVTQEEAWGLFLQQDRKCAYTGLLLSFLHSFQYGRNQSASLDRIDSSKPYVIGNIQWVHRKINLMKGTLSHEKFIELCRMVSNAYLEKSSR